MRSNRQSDRSRQSITVPLKGYYPTPVEGPLLGEGQGDSGKTPSIKHSKNLPMGNNKRAPFKSSLIFDK